MTNNMNPGFLPEEISQLKAELEKAGSNFVRTEGEIQNDEIAHFQFIGHYEGKEAIFDAALYTLELAYNGKLYSIAEEEAKKEFPDYQGFDLEEEPESLTEEDEEVRDFMSGVMMELESDDSFKVQESVVVDPDFDYGIGLEVALNVELVTDQVIKKFVTDYTSGKLKLDDTLYSFPYSTEEDE